MSVADAKAKVLEQAKRDREELQRRKALKERQERTETSAAGGKTTGLRVSSRLYVVHVPPNMSKEQRKLH